MLRQKWGSVVCPSCRNLVGVNDEKCLTCGRWNPGLWGFAPWLNRLGKDLGFTQFVVGACIALYALMLAMYPEGIDLRPSFGFLSPSPRSLFLFGESGVDPVFVAGRWWTVLTAGWLHGGLLHIFFNLMSIRQLAPPTSEVYGPSRMIIIYVIAGITGFTLSTVAQLFGFPLTGGARATLGASAPICGLLGALIYYGKRSGSSMITNQAKSWIASLILMGFLMRGIIDNWAHFGGLAGGYFASKVMDPLRPERLDHMIIALISLIATGLAFVYSIVHGVRILRMLGI